jgi:hypothetical protein
VGGRAGRDQRPNHRRRPARTGRALLTASPDHRSPLRHAGRATLADGRLLLWSVAEGRRGRRWRASTRTTEGSLIDDLLLEVEPSGRLARLELTTAAGQLTFHAEPDEREAHGNAVLPTGMRHFTLAWAPGRGVEISWSPIADAILVGAPGARGEPEGVVARIGADLVPALASTDLEQLGAGWWRVNGRDVHLDAAGLPMFENGQTWALEEPGSGAS